MALNRTERVAAMSYLLKQDYAALGRLIEETQNLSQPKKIDLLSSALQLAAPGARISYTDEAKRVIDDIVSVINEGDERSLSVVVAPTA